MPLLLSVCFVWLRKVAPHMKIKETKYMKRMQGTCRTESAADQPYISYVYE
jgi:hypothetical protein